MFLIRHTTQYVELIAILVSGTPNIAWVLDVLRHPNTDVWFGDNFALRKALKWGRYDVAAYIISTQEFKDCLGAQF